MAITAFMVKKLREKTGAGIMDCKKSLVEANGNLEGAVNWLKIKGLAFADKKSGRVAAEGLTAIAVDGIRGAVIEINSESDFVSRNKIFQELVQNVAEVAMQHDDLVSLKSAKATSGKTIEEEIIANIATIGEHLNLRRMHGYLLTNFH
jgi:elongation factor Ts